MAVALGGTLGNSKYKTIEGDTVGVVWSASRDSHDFVFIIDTDGSGYGYDAYTRNNAVCPAMLISETSKICPKNVKTVKFADDKTVQTCEYGAYPQTIVSQSVSAKLGAEYQNDKLKKTGKSYTFDSVGLMEFNIGFTPKSSIEYSFWGKKFGGSSIMSDGTEVEDGVPYWFEVEPIEWLMDKKTGIWRAKKGLIAGIQFDNNKEYDGNFEKTNMCHYLNTYFAKEMKMEREFVETKSRLFIRNHYFSNYVSGMGDNKTFYPEGKDGNKFTPAKAQEIIDITNATPFMRDVLKMIAMFPKEEQGQFKEQVLNVFDKSRHPYDQPNEVLVWGKKLAVSGGYEKELNQVIDGATPENVMRVKKPFFWGRLLGGRT